VTRRRLRLAKVSNYDVRQHCVEPPCDPLTAAARLAVGTAPRSATPRLRAWPSRADQPSDLRLQVSEVARCSRGLEEQVFGFLGLTGVPCMYSVLD